MKVAVLGCIHGNLPALDAVLAQVQSVAPDAIVLLGDIALGPMPAETLDRLMQLGDAVHWVHGNCERELVASYLGEPVDGPNADVARAAADRLEPAHVRRLQGLPMTLTLDVDGMGPVLFCHASPRADDEMLLVDSPVDAWEPALAEAAQETVVCAHSHMPFDRLVGGKRVVNVGSVGMPYGPPGACWAVLGPDVVLRRTMYDARHASRVIESRGIDGADRWAQEYVLNTHSDLEALAAFTAIAERQRR